MSGFAPGDIVVCVDAKMRPGCADTYALRRLVEGKAYTIEEINRHNGGLYIVEIPTLSAFYEDRFRKIDKSDEGFAAWMRSLRPIPAKHNRKVEA